jgi:hypothetical protein
MVIELNILHERAMEVIRYLEKVKDVEVLSSPPSDQPSVNPSENGPTSPLKETKDRVQRNWAGILKDRDTSDMEEYFKNVRDEWEDRY